MTDLWKTEARKREAGEYALELFQHGYHCSEAIARAVGGRVLPDQTAADSFLRLTGILQGGMAGSHQSECGVLTAGFMIIAEKYGRTDPGESERKMLDLSQQYRQMFRDEFTITGCDDLRQGEPGPEAPTCCGTIVVRGARMLISLLEEPDHRTDGCH